MKTTRALIFDFDGVLVNTEPMHMQAWIEVLSALKISFTQKDYDERYIGLNDRDFLAKIFGEKKHSLTPKLQAELIHQKEAKKQSPLKSNRAGAGKAEAASIFLPDVIRKPAVKSGISTDRFNFFLMEFCNQPNSLL